MHVNELSWCEPCTAHHTDMFPVILSAEHAFAVKKQQRLKSSWWLATLNGTIYTHSTHIHTPLHLTYDNIYIYTYTYNVYVGVIFLVLNSFQELMQLITSFAIYLLCSVHF